MKTLIFNGSPRKNWNTHKLLEEAKRGAEHAGSETELIHLYDYKFQGCISCFACKRKGNTTDGICVCRDDIAGILQKVRTADVLIFGTPVYLHGATSQFRAFLERVLYPITTYLIDEKTGERVRFLKKKVATGLIYTMNNPASVMDSKKYPVLLGINGELLQTAYGHNETLYVNDTLQFTDYSKYLANMFDEKAKLDVHEKQFPEEQKKAYELGGRLVRTAEAWKK